MISVQYFFVCSSYLCQPITSPFVRRGGDDDNDDDDGGSGGGGGGSDDCKLEERSISTYSYAQGSITLSETTERKRTKGDSGGGKEGGRCQSMHSFCIQRRADHFSGVCERILKNNTLSAFAGEHCRAWG